MIAGITGHMKLGNAAAWLESEILYWLRRNPVQMGLSSLAPGADSIFADACLQLHIPLIAILPSYQYDSAYSPEDKHTYLRLLKAARSCHTMAHPIPSEEAFWEAGIHIVNHCGVLLAAWDGLPAKGLGGTADIVSHAISSHRTVIHFHTLLKTVQPL